MTDEPIGPDRPAELDYRPLDVKPDRAMLAAYRMQYEAVPPTGKLDETLWQRRYRLGSFAQANGMDSAFGADPKHWPGMLSEIPMRWPGKISDVSKLQDVLQGSGPDGRAVMVCGLEIVRCRGAITGRDIQFDHYTVAALPFAARTKQVFLKHRWRKHPEAPDLLEANYTLDDPFAVMWTPKDKHELYGVARSVLTQEVLALVLRVAPGYDLFLSGGWLYLMKPYGGFSDMEKRHADPDLLRERFEIAAQLGPALAAAVAAHAAAKAQGPAKAQGAAKAQAAEIPPHRAE